ncbi:hypothetical protein ACIP93_32890 [Streptomyces sp. NPDC088745]|uniref:hypothetical protein n=1 Tax=Streptomyces sp. NPDC088745 TaxID=3365884 RepID=UPI00382DD706
MKGKEAAQAAARRQRQAEAEAERLRDELARLHEQHAAETASLQEQIDQLTRTHIAEAGKLAGQAVLAAQQEAANARREAGTSQEEAEQVRAVLDALVRSACQYLSMSQGMQPLAALVAVLVWMTGKPSNEITNLEETASRLSLPQDGWAFRLLRSRRSWLRQLRGPGQSWANVMSLEEAERDYADELLHPDYDPAWYAPTPSPSRPASHAANVYLRKG